MDSALARSLAATTLVGVLAAGAFASRSLAWRADRSETPAEEHRPPGPSGTPGSPGLDDGAPLPATLAETGFFTLRRESFTPQYPLWSDGAAKQRWIHLPAGTSIGAADPDAWEFPIGTRFWKEFSFAGAVVETRFIVRAHDGWHFASYLWNADGTATRAPAAGLASVELAPGVRHRIPGQGDCRACHATGPVPVLGFSALQLSPDRDPNAVHAEAARAADLDLTALVARGRLRGLPPAMLLAPPRIPGPPTERAALGYLHANCGGCHRHDGALATVGMELAHSLRAPGGATRSTIGVASHFMAPRVRVAPGDAGDSVVLARMRSRSPLSQMPPLGSQLVDAEGTKLIASWIDQLPAR